MKRKYNPDTGELVVESDEQTELTDGEREAVERSAFGATLDNIIAAERSTWEAGQLEELKKYKTPEKVEKTDKGRAIQLLDRKGEEVHRLMAPTEQLYVRMSTQERQWRSPDADHWMVEWMRGQVKNNDARMSRAHAGLEQIYGRALMTEGLAGAGGAVSDGTAGELIPRPLEQVILIARDRVSKMRRFASHIVMTRQQHNVPTAAAMTAFMTTEGATATDGSPAIAQVPLIARKGQVTALMTVELMADSAINVMNMIATRGGGALGELEDDQFFADGNGTAPNVSAFLSGTAHAEDTATEFNFADAVDMYFSVNQIYRPNAVWFISGDVMKFIALLLTGAPEKQFWLDQTGSPAPITDDPTAEGTILRRPVFEVPLTPGTVWFGDPSASYTVGTRAGLTSSMSEHVKFDVDQIMWKLTQRFDGNNVDHLAAAQVAVGITSAGII